MARIELVRCPHGIESLCIGNIRITGPKCCGQWTTVRFFTLCDEPDEIVALLRESPDAD